RSASNAGISVPLAAAWSMRSRDGCHEHFPSRCRPRGPPSGGGRARRDRLELVAATLVVDRRARNARRGGPAVTWLDVRTWEIPPALRALPWVLWRAEERGGDKPSKVPVRVSDPSKRASSTDPATWATFADAVDAYHALRGTVTGIGVVLTQAAGVTCI